MAKELGSSRLKRATNEIKASKDGETIAVQNENREVEGIPIDTAYPSAKQEVTPLDFGKIKEYNPQIYEESPTSNENYFHKQASVQTPVRQYTLTKQVPQTTGTLFSQAEVNYEYKETLITEATEIDSISDSTFLLDYVYKKEKEVGATLLVEAYGVSDHIFENSTTHEIITLGNERYFSNKQETLNKERLDALMEDIAKALSTVGYYDLPLIKKHTFSIKEGVTNCIKAMSINTYEFNAIMGLGDRFESLSSCIFEKENNTFMRFQQSKE